MIKEAFLQADAAARAAARFERDVYERQRAQQIKAGYTPEDAGEMDQVFDQTDFNDMMQKYLQLYTELHVIDWLELDQYRDAILHQRVEQIFGATKAKATKTVFFGDATAQFNHSMKQQ